MKFINWEWKGYFNMLKVYVWNVSVLLQYCILFSESSDF